LLQHKDNPVDWYEWGEAAFTEARGSDRPILLSVGYSACHWCHVMAHESFEDESTAVFMNEHFVNVKVDREERPDVDRIYMDAVTAMSGHGGWPMTVFLTPEGKPLYAGTYFPRQRMHGRPSFLDVMAAVSEAWATRRPEAEEQAERLTLAISQSIPVAPSAPGIEIVDAALDQLSASFDPGNGGFGGAPKFPQAPTLEFLLRMGAIAPSPAARGRALSMLAPTLDAMARGGIRDHLGGGFARYSVDAAWQVPHFEKMLYDNALLARTYLRGWQLTGDAASRHVATDTLDYLLCDMMDPAGGLHAAEDADSEGGEGEYYVWSWDELGSILGADRRLAAEIYGATPEGSFEGRNILHLDRPPDAEAKASIDGRLLEARGRRTRPGRDDKIVTAWNGLALRAFAEAGAVLAEERYLAAATAIARFLTGQLEEHGGLLRSWRRGRPGPAGFCEDHAATAVGLFTLYQATGEERWYHEATGVTELMIERFADPAGGFFATAAGGERLITRPKNIQDNPTPSDNALAAEALLMWGAYTGERQARDLLEGAVRAATLVIERHPAFAGHLLAVWATVLLGVKEVAAPGAPDLARVVWERFRPEVVLATEGTLPLLDGRTRGMGYVCRDMVCELPVTTPDALRAQLAGV
ncbi:MAG: thioredoxin domain-containing protein, partial [Actinobacteria bacterium]